MLVYRFDILMLIPKKETNTIKRLASSHTGFTLLHILPVIVVVAVLAFTGGNVYQAQVKKQDAARLAADADHDKKMAELKVQAEKAKETEVTVPATAEPQKTVEQPAPAPVKKTTPTPIKTTETKKSYTYVGISGVAVAQEGDNVTITASLAGSYNGVCGAKVKLQSDYSKYEYKEASFNGTTCSVTFPKASLNALGTSLVVFMNWHSTDYTTKGDHGGHNFTL